MKSMRVRLPSNSPQPGPRAGRRDLLRLVAGLVSGGLSALHASTEIDALEVDRLWDRSCPEETSERSYRVDATVLLLSVPVLRRAGVGDARVAQRRIRGVAGTNKLALEFAAASDPQRAHGLDRMGWIREVVLEQDGAPRRAGVLGIMSDSPEETADEARTALSQNPNTEKLIAIDSSYLGGREGRTSSRVIRFRAPRRTYTGGDDLADIARTSFRSCPARWKEARWPEADAAPATFLYALKRALEQDGSRSIEYVWNQDLYSMRIQREPDAAASREFEAAVDRIRGELQNTSRNLRPLHFQIWIDRNSAVPLPFRVEFQPRPFLRLTLEAVAPSNQIKEAR